MAITYVPGSFAADSQNPGSGTTFQISSGAALTAGSLIVVTVQGRQSDVSFSTCVGSLNGSYTKAVQSEFGGSAIFYFENSGSGSETVTVTWNASTNWTWYAQISEWAGAKTSGALDQVAGTTLTPTGTGPYNYKHTPDGQDLAITGAGLVIGCGGLTGNVTGKSAGSGYTALGYTPTDSRPYLQYKLATSAGSETAPWSATDSADYYSAIANFLEATATGIPKTTKAMLLGIG